MNGDSDGRTSNGPQSFRNHPFNYFHYFCPRETRIWPLRATEQGAVEVDGVVTVEQEAKFLILLDDEYGVCSFFHRFHTQLPVLHPVPCNRFRSFTSRLLHVARA